MNYTVSEPDGIIDDVIATTRELQMSTGIGVLTLTFSIAQDDTDEDPEDFLLLLKGTRRVFVICPVGRVTILCKDLYGHVCIDLYYYFLFLQLLLWRLVLLLYSALYSLIRQYHLVDTLAICRLMGQNLILVNIHCKTLFGV